MKRIWEKLVCMLMVLSMVSGAAACASGEMNFDGVVKSSGTVRGIFAGAGDSVEASVNRYGAVLYL